MGNIITLASKLKHCYYLTRMTLSDDSLYFKTLTKLEQAFINYLIQQVGFEELELELKERQKQMQVWEEKVIQESEALWGQAPTLKYDTQRINGNKYVLTKNQSTRLEELVQPLILSENRLGYIAIQDKQYSSSIVGSNWKFKKVFPTFKATAKANPKYVFPPEVVDELINNYFLALKFGFTLEEIS